MMCHLAMLKIFTVTQVQLSPMQFLIHEAVSHYENKSILSTPFPEIAHTSETIFMAQFSYVIYQSILLKI